MRLRRFWSVALYDLKMAMRYRFIKAGVIGTGAFGPFMSILVIVPILIGDPSASSYMGYLLAFVSSFLAIFAIIPASLIGANAFVGEREENTLEPLLCSPLTDRELLLGKTLSSAIPSLIILVSGIIATEIGMNLIFSMIGYPLMLVPDLPGLFLLFTTTPVMILVVVFIMIIISGRVSRVYEAYQVAGASILVYMIPMIVPTLFIGSNISAESVVWFSNIVTLLISLVLLVMTSYLAIRMFNRDRMITQI